MISEMLTVNQLLAGILLAGKCLSHVNIDDIASEFFPFILKTLMTTK